MPSPASHSREAEEASAVNVQPTAAPGGASVASERTSDEAEARQLSRRRREGEAQQPPAQDPERRQQRQEGEAGGGVSRRHRGPAAPRGRGAGGDPGEPRREADADRGLVARHVHDELAQQQDLCRGGEEPGREKGRVAHEAESTPRR